MKNIKKIKDGMCICPKMMVMFILIMLISPVASNAIEYYVATNGLDTNPGTEAGPFRTLARARDAVRTINSDMSENVVVYIRGGEYQVTNAIHFGEQDSGNNGYKVLYSAYPGEEPILTGGRSVTRWTLHDKEKNIYRGSTTTKPFRQLYVNDAMAIRARHPNRRSTTDNSPYWECKVPEIPKMRIKKEYWEACGDVPESKRSEIEMVMISHWYHQRLRVGTVRIDGGDVEITPAKPNSNFSKKPNFYKKNGIIDNPFYFENAYAFIDAPYEWYHDAGKGIVYMMFPNDITPDKVRVEFPVAETLIVIDGSPEAPVRDLEFRGVVFQLSNWNKPSTTGINMTQAAQVIGGDFPPAMISAMHVQRLAFRNNTFQKARSQGLELYDADFSDVEGNTFHTIAANAIVIDSGTGTNPEPDKQSVGIAIWNNDASTCGSHYSNGMFLFASNVRKLTVAHNHIYDLPYSGMQIGQQPGGIRGKEYWDVGCGENTIINNHIHHVCQIHGDGGGIYTLGGIQVGTVIAGNYIHDTEQSKWDHYHVSQIYLDNNSSKITVKDNVTKGGKAEARNGLKGNLFSNNTQGNPAVEKNAGIKPGYNPGNEEN